MNKQPVISNLTYMEEQFRLMVETTNERIWSGDAEGRMTYNNPAVERILGYHPAELLGKNALHFIHEDDRQEISAIITHLISEKKGWTNLVCRWRHKNGTYRYLESNSVPILGLNGEFYGYRGADRDITERKLSEMELYRLAAIIESSEDAIISRDLEGLITSWNKGAQNVFGYTAAEVIGQPINILFPADRLGEETQILEFIRAGKTVSSFDTVRVRKGGNQIPVSITTSPIKDRMGNLVGISKIAHDISKRKEFDAALRDSEYKMRTLLENMSEGLAQVTNDEVIEFVNNGFCQMTGYEPQELIGKTIVQLLFDQGDSKYIKAVSQQRLKGQSSQYELLLKKKSGEALNVIVGGAPIINSEGKIISSMGVFTDITERKRAEKQLLHDAFHDRLTGLANRNLFIDHLNLTIERNKRKLDTTFAVLFLNIDRFKIINDTLGHSHGNELLKKIAERIITFLRSGDLVARVGGDEFTILLDDLETESEALRITERILKDLQIPFDLNGQLIYTSATIGIALKTNGNNTKAEDMIRDAEIAMYQAKTKGKAQYQVFDQAMHENVLKKIQLETEIRQALERKEFCLHFQPIVNLKKNELVGFEALVRWNHPVRGLVPPLEFIPAAEETGLILPLGKWILYESCRQLCKWQKYNSLAWSISISVNLSCKQFLQPDLADQIALVLEETGLAPSCLKLEITESYILEDIKMAIETMNRLRKLGVEISLDDFGTGYSSLSYLHSLPIDYLKIDRSFISRMTDSKKNAEIVRTIINLAQNLKMKVVAEGIETASQLDELKKLNCELGQGYFFSKPLNASAAALINSAKADVYLS